MHAIYILFYLAQIVSQLNKSFLHLFLFLFLFKEYDQSLFNYKSSKKTI